MPSLRKGFCGVCLMIVGSCSYMRSVHLLFGTVHLGNGRMLAIDHRRI